MKAMEPNMSTWFKRLERPVPGTDTKKLLGLDGFVGADGNPFADGDGGAGVFAVVDGGVPTPLSYMPQSLFLLHESFDDDLLAEECGKCCLKVVAQACWAE